MSADSARPAPARFGPKWPAFLVAVACVLPLDQWTKHAVAARFAYGERLAVVDGFLDLTHVRNPGGAFSFLADASPELRSLFFVGMACVAIAMLVVFFARLPAEDRGVAAALGAILGGAVGNLLDRLRHGEVVDFIDVHLPGGYTWPTFNVADSAIVVGVIVLLLATFVEEREARREAAAAVAEPTD